MSVDSGTFNDKKGNNSGPESYFQTNPYLMVDVYVSSDTEKSIRENIEDEKKKKKNTTAKYSLNAQFKGWECYGDSSNDSTD
ncbi:hypothetical protein TNCV_1652521 [Trichonephila clavipes]|nr:hypothetical protein TNCV_1652521 [Trichonephila clavipes]